MSTETMTQRAESLPSLTAPTTRVFLLLGFAVWLAATVAFRLAGQYLLNPSAPVVVGGLFVAVVPAMIGLALVLYRWRGVTGATRLQAAIALVLPGMLLDSLAVAWFGTVFPNMVPGAAKYFGGMLLLAYASILLSGFIPSRR
ncbi:DUF5367 family protein [Haladaptatus sp. NG-SE-30]